MNKLLMYYEGKEKDHIALNIDENTSIKGFLLAIKCFDRFIKDACKKAQTEKFKVTLYVEHREKPYIFDTAGHSLHYRYGKPVYKYWISGKDGYTTRTISDFKSILNF